MSKDELRQAILDYVRRKGRVQQDEMRAGLKITGNSVWLTIWYDLLEEGEIELCPGYHPDYPLAKYQLRIQPRLL